MMTQMGYDESPECGRLCGVDTMFFILIMVIILSWESAVQPVVTMPPSR